MRGNQSQRTVIEVEGRLTMDGLKLEAVEFESTQETKQGNVYAELVEAKKTLEFNENMYLANLKAIEQRKKLMLWGIEVKVPMAFLFLFLAWIFSWNLLFGWEASLLCLLIMVWFIQSSIRTFISWSIHTARIDKKGIYTLSAEQNNINSELKRLREAAFKVDVLIKQKKTVWNPEEDPDITASRVDSDAYEVQGRKLLSEISYELTYKERRADYLYGERIK